MKNAVLLVATTAALTACCVTGRANVTFDGRTGAIRGFSFADGRPIATAVENRWQLLSTEGDAEALEREDEVVARADEPTGGTVFTCRNPKLPEIEIVKRYRFDAQGVKRTLTFVNKSRTSKYVTPFTEVHLDPSFQKDVWHLGAGYIGPYKPFPSVSAPRRVSEFKQSSKGLVFVHPEGTRRSFSHFRVKIDDTVVLPWWHSTIGHYREYHDRLLYLPNGYRMGLGTFGLYPGRPVSVTDRFDAFDGGLFAFFDGVFMKDADVACEFASIPPPPVWIGDIVSLGFATPVDFECRWLPEMLDDGLIVNKGDGVFSWGDYRFKNGFHSPNGGFITGPEARAALDAERAFSPRVRTHYYNIVISTSFFTAVFREHPEWFRDKDRDGNRDSLFPGLQYNWQTMFCHPDCRNWMVDMLCRFADDCGTDVIYLDEFQMTNTIDWQRDCVTRDDDTVKFWKALKARMAAEGKMLFANGSGSPYADINYMESPHELAPARWRDWAGIGWGISMMNRLRPGMRACPLYWSAHLDYANRVLALGWLPRSGYRIENLPVIRAAYQVGAMVPVDARLSPDWMRDASINVENHAMRRTDARDVLVSFISRAAEPRDLPVTIDLGTLGFVADERVHVWRIRLDHDGASKKPKPEFLSDSELKRNWREWGIIAGARISDPELVYSGPATGSFHFTVPGLGPNRMEQFLVTEAGPVLYAENGLPLSYPFTAQHRARIEGRRAHVEREADLLLMDRDFSCRDVTANGKPVETRPVRVGNRVGRLVHLEKGDWELAWKPGPVETNLALATLPTATTERFRTSVRLPSLPMIPEEKNVREVDVRRGAVTIRRAGTFHTKGDDSRSLQPELPTAALSADPNTLRLKAGTTRREAYWTFMDIFSGFEIEGAKSVRCRFSHTFKTAISLQMRHTPKNGGHRPEKAFAGLMVDYSVGGKYTKRVAFAAGLYHQKCAVVNPAWGTGRAPDENLDLGDWIEGPAERTFSLDLAKFAPTGWDGRVWISLGTAQLRRGRTLRLDILSFNETEATDFANPSSAANSRVMPPPLKSRPLKAKPKSLTEIDVLEWGSWAKSSAFVSLGEGRLRAVTRVYAAHDYENLYLGFVAEESGRSPLAADPHPAYNEHCEFLIVRPDGTLYQVLGDAKGRSALYLDKKQADASRVTIHGKDIPGKGWCVFMAIPVDDLKFDMQRTPVTVKAEFCRTRRDPPENACWTPLAHDFFERNLYGTLILDFNWSK